MSSKHVIISLVIALVGSNLYWLLGAVDDGVTLTYVEADAELTRNALDQTIVLANADLIGLSADEVLEMLPTDISELEPFEKEGCLYYHTVCLKLSESRIVTGIRVGAE